jgi:hypothetical protein
MAKIQKTAGELKELIFERLVMRVNILPHKSQGWTATFYSSIPHTPDHQRELDRLVIELRAKYELKSESTAIS